MQGNCDEFAIPEEFRSSAAVNLWRTAMCFSLCRNRAGVVRGHLRSIPHQKFTDLAIERRADRLQGGEADGTGAIVFQY